MKFLASLILLSTLWAGQSLEFIAGSLTVHFPFPAIYSSPPHYSGALDPDGYIIVNPLVGMRIVSENAMGYISGLSFAGVNSRALVMAGFVFSSGFRIFPWLYTGAVVGLYIQPFSGGRSTPFYLGAVDIVPVVGLEAVVRIPLGRTWFLSFSNILTPLLLNTSIGLGWHLK